VHDERGKLTMATVDDAPGARRRQHAGFLSYAHFDNDHDDDVVAGFART
jgi:hypothetical protein